MIYTPRPYDPDAPALVIDIGNTATKIATWHEGKLRAAVSVSTNDAVAFQSAYDAHIEAMPGGQSAALIIASVVPDALERIRELIIELTDHEPLVVGEKVPFPIETDLTDEQTLGTDRVCAAAAAYETIQGPCTITSFGTAVTVDVVNESGTLLGGAILPGVSMQLRALHEHTAALPMVEPGCPNLPYGRNTIEAIQTGVVRGIAGSVRGLVEGYAIHLGQWPQLVATGGDLELLLPYCDFIDSAVPDLALRGVGIAYSRFLVEMGA